MRTTASALVLLLATLTASNANATDGFPGVVRRFVGASADPPCAICHAGGQTGRGTVTTPFGQALLARGVVAYDDASLERALTQLRADGVDSNENGVPDIEELRQGRDPSVGGSIPALQYGCAVDGDAANGDVALVVLLLGLVVAMRRRSRHAIPPE